MAFTDQLGVADSRLGNIELGMGTNGTTGTVWSRSFSDIVTYSEIISNLLRTLALNSSDELDPTMLLLLSGDEQSGYDKLDLSGSY